MPMKNGNRRYNKLYHQSLKERMKINNIVEHLGSLYNNIEQSIEADNDKIDTLNIRSYKHTIHWDGYWKIGRLKKLEKLKLSSGTNNL